MNLQGQANTYGDQDANDYFGDEGSDGGLNLRAILATVWRGRWIIAVSMAVALIFAFITISQMVPVYRASAHMLFTGNNQNITDIREVVLTDSSPNQLNNEIQILNSTSLLGNVADRLNLPERYANAPVDDSFGIADLLNWRTYVSRETLVTFGILEPRPETAPASPEEVEQRYRQRAIASLRGSLSFQPVPNSRVIVISATSPNPRYAAQVVNAVTQAFIESQLNAEVDATRQASEWLGDRINDLRIRVENAELKVETARAKQAAAAGQTAEITDQQLTATNGALAQARADRSQLEVRYRSVSSALRNSAIDLGAVSVFRDAPVIQQLRAKESDLLDRDAALEEFARDNPNRRRIRAEIDRIRSAIRSEAERIVAALAADLEVARQRVQVLEEQVSDLEAVNQEQRRGDVELRQLEREAQASRVLYENFLARLEETQQQETLISPDARVLSPAEVPTIPQGGGKKRVLLLCLILGAGAGVGIVFLLDKLNNTFRGVKQLEDATGLPVLAVLPSVGNAVDRSDVIRQLYEKPNGRLAEAVRNLRTSLLFASAKAAPKVIVFTSSVPGEGKSTSALLMALTSQQMGRSAIIVDCDMRLRALSSLVEHEEDRPGLLSVLKGTATVDEAVDVDPNTGLMILAVRPGEADGTLSAADIVASRYFADLVEHLSKVFDLVVLDTPPVLAVSDARIASSLADAIVYAVLWDGTPRGAVAEGLRELRSVEAPIAGLMLTMVDSEKVASYAYEGYGHYRARYGEYYS
ncbi:Wzz/FepE/Etk N-terminal domain-containing protein [Acuticoccus sp. I52.16.1]|uniref:GumC family protein n=1 Tax=Acuticoccus sp. I52.16.1 TaxID=2928472 RepID=UPI001FD5D2A8|nr:Wzz/FepE/Etk N-terminal domain-containing protein [Acuticoccus sp. I52.16.1]UOM32859.1 Wzz/FepE/Etk N-terminal domain-containing protein [Acuticoccus sp. I52.16.1]